MSLFIVFENAIAENEWWILDTFDTFAEAKVFVEGIVDDETESHYRIVRYEEQEVLVEI